MRGLVLVVTALLSTVMSDEASEEPRQFWPGRTRRAWREVHRPANDARGFLGHGKFLEIPSPRVLGASVNLPTLAVIGRLDNEKRPDLIDREPNYVQSSANRKDLDECRLINPTILVSLDFRRLLDDENRQEPDCTAGKCRRTEAWQLAKPFYVDEPRWVEVEADYVDSFVDEFPTKDPYVLSRGKKLRGEAGLADYQEDDQDPDDHRHGPISDPRRFKSFGLVQRKRSRSSNRNDQDAGPVNRDRDGFKRDLEVLDKSEDPFFLTRGKKNSLTETQDYDDEYEAKDVNERRPAQSGRDKRSIDPRPHESIRDRDRTERKLDDRTESLYSETKPEVGVNTSRIDSWAVDDRSLVSRLRKRNIKNDPFKPRGERSDQNRISSWSSDKPGSNGNRLFLDTTELQRRNRHSDLFELLEEPFFISRGKKEALETSGTRIYPEREDFRYENLFGTTGNALTGTSCGSKDCLDKLARSSRTKGPRDRRGTLDELLAKYDPFYLARGKRPKFRGRIQRNVRPDFEGTRGTLGLGELANRI